MKEEEEREEEEALFHTAGVENADGTLHRRQVWWPPGGIGFRQQVTAALTSAPSTGCDGARGKPSGGHRVRREKKNGHLAHSLPRRPPLWSQSVSYSDQTNSGFYFFSHLQNNNTRSPAHLGWEQGVAGSPPATVSPQRVTWPLLNLPCLLSATFIAEWKDFLEWVAVLKSDSLNRHLRSVVTNSVSGGSPGFTGALHSPSYQVSTSISTTFMHCCFTQASDTVQPSSSLHIC